MNTDGPAEKLYLTGAVFCLIYLVEWISINLSKDSKHVVWSTSNISENIVPLSLSLSHDSLQFIPFFDFRAMKNI